MILRWTGLQPRIDLRPGLDIPKYPEDDIDADPHFNEYLPDEEFVEGPDWTPSQIPPQIRSPEYDGNFSDASSDTQVSRIIQAVSVTTGSDRPGQAAASTPAGGDTRKVELKHPLRSWTSSLPPTWNGKSRNKWKNRVSRLSRRYFRDLPTV